MKSLEVVTGILFLMAGCIGCGTLEPEPSRPQYTVSIDIDSIPHGADVYAIESDGQVGAKIGTTPFTHTIGVAAQYWVDSSGEPYSLKNQWAWGHGVSSKWDNPSSKMNSRILVYLNIALTKGNHSLAVGKKMIYSSDDRRDKKVFLTVPLKTLAQVNRETEVYLRQRAINGQRNINVRHEKDGLDSINSGLDALIKLNGLGAFR